MGVVVLCLVAMAMILGNLGEAAGSGGWYTAHATFYGDMSGGETMRE